jgi:hypothetical protein
MSSGKKIQIRTRNVMPGTKRLSLWLGGKNQMRRARQQKKLAPGQVTNSAANREVQTDAKISERTKQEK